MSHILVDKLGRPVQDLRISVIDRCNFRCTYCMPENTDSKPYSFLKSSQWLSFDEIVRLSRIFADLGVRKFRVTGGEPLLRPNIIELVERLSRIEHLEDLALTTNGMDLKEFAGPLKTAGLQRLTVSLDALDARVFHSMNGRKGHLQDVLEGINVAQEKGFTSIKINVVIQKGVNDHQIMDIVKYFRGTNHIVRFIEYMDVGNCNHWQQKYVVPSNEILNMIRQAFPLEPADQNYYGEVAQRYRYLDGSGEVGFISSISQPFCQACTRVRLTADGQIVTCLFAKQGTSVKEWLKESMPDSEIADRVSNLWKSRTDRYSLDRQKSLGEDSDQSKLEMYHIGG